MDTARNKINLDSGIERDRKIKRDSKKSTIPNACVRATESSHSKKE